MPDLSIVIPTRDRLERLLLTLEALGRQTIPGGAFEVIVVADGCRDNTAARIRSLAPPFALRVLEQPASGAAAARNRGADNAAAPILLFLDDDMEALPGLLATHLAAHRGHPGDVALGYFRFPRNGRNADIVVSHIDNWWGDRFSSMCRESHRFTFLDLFTGNVSLPRDLFVLSGRFDERFHGRAGEDYELAARLLKRGVRFRFIREAACIHHDTPTHRRLTERAYAEGRGHLLIAARHPETFPALPLREAADGGPWIRVGPGFRVRPWTLNKLSTGLALLLEAARRLKARRILRPLLGCAHYCSYWGGVLNELGSLQELRRFAQDMPLKPSDVVELELDLGTDMERLGAILEENPAGAARLWYGDKQVGYIPSLPVSESLRAEHVLDSIMQNHDTEFLAAHLDGKRRDPKEGFSPGAGRDLGTGAVHGHTDRASMGNGGSPLKTFVAEYDLAKPVRAVWGLQGYTQGVILVRKDGQPVDLLWVPHSPQRFMLTGREIEQYVYHQLGISPAMRDNSGPAGKADPPEPLPAISVVVCTRDRPRSLHGCLASLARLGPGSCEVIVVDNASGTGETKELVAETPFRYVREDRVGLNRARNRGACEASHAIVAYVDDDVRVDPGWLRGIARGFRSTDVDAVTGLVLPAELETRPQLLFEIYRGMDKEMEARRYRNPIMYPHGLIRGRDVVVETNMAFRRKVLEGLGGFDTALETGTPSGGGGDLDLFQRVLVSGGTVRYEPSAIVWRYNRRDFEGLRRQLYDNGRSYGVFLMKCWKAGSIARSGIASFVVFRWAPWLVGRLGLRLVRRHRLPLRLLWAEFWGAIHSPWAFVQMLRHERSIRKEFPL
jgi:glycosyltransferase involved in cell wall biosynthesis